MYLPRTIALFGTSADPPTLGHRAILAYVSQHFDHVAVWASDNPFKTHGATLAQRQRMLALLLQDGSVQDGSVQGLSVQGLPVQGLPVQDLPLLRSKVRVYPSLSHRRTLHTVEQAQERWPGAQLTLVIGSDLVTQILQWYQAETLLSSVSLLVIQRPQAPLQGSALERLRQRTTVTLADFMGPPVSSTAYREQGLITALSPAVCDYIHSHQLYARVSPCQNPSLTSRPKP
ncbi:nicotinate-nucleotide adenylyltransferase [Prochlorothrix hollandica]|uniref:nicotinate-nucleotide adenylyltransferase n=1 Tax=Prochlorothrix hollandica TaxID=1223 RepID=UPI00034DFB11|nr:nicotinate-nucleotide adenylyltransferase [Prochlorothrix hollandica]